MKEKKKKKKGLTPMCKVTQIFSQSIVLFFSSPFNNSKINRSTFYLSQPKQIILDLDLDLEDEDLEEEEEERTFSFFTKRPFILHFNFALRCRYIDYFLPQVTTASPYFKLK